MISNNREIEFYMRGKQDAKKELQELITELNSKVMLKDKQIKKALKFIEEEMLGKPFEQVNWDFDEVVYSDLPVCAIKPLVDILNEEE